MVGKLFEQILLGLVFTYIAFNLWTIYEVFYPKECSDSPYCLKALWTPQDFIKINLDIFHGNKKLKTDEVMTEFFKLTSGFESVYNITVPIELFKNGSADCEITITHEKQNVIFNKRIQLSSYRLPKAKAFNLMSSNNTEVPNPQADETIAHWLSSLYIAVLKNPVTFDRKAMPPEIHSIVSAKSIQSEYYYLPIFHINPKLQPTSDWIELEPETQPESRKLGLLVKVEPLSIGKLRLRCLLEQTTASLATMGFKEKDVEDIRGLFTDTNFYLLMTTIAVSVFHLFFDFLAFKNDVQFWRSAENTAGISIRTIVWRCFSTTIIFAYLFEQRSSLLILVPSGVGVVIEFWKLTRMTKVSFSFGGGLVIGSRSKEEQETDNLDAHFMRRLMFLMVPLCIGGAVYSLVYMPHRSWFSWVLQTAVNGVYAFGFLLMTPQLFINYRLKSVANLPWRALTYKAFNTFIDDFFAFIIKMPTAHRIACFRDDIIFIIYIYQRWLYPVDHSRVNEFGQRGDERAAEAVAQPPSSAKKVSSSKVKTS